MKFKEKLNQKTANFCKNSSGEDMTFKEVMGYSTAGFGQNLICGIVGSFLMIFMTDALGFGAKNCVIWGVAGADLVAYLMLGTRIFDAFNDPIMGSIVDRTRTKWGKCRPYLLWTPIPIAIMTIMCFLPVYPANATGYIIMAVLYVIWSVVYTIVDVPYWGLSTAMTNDTDLRSKLLTVARLLASLGAGLVIVILPLISTALTNKYHVFNAEGVRGDLIPGMAGQNMETLKWFYFACAVILSIAAVPMFWYGFKTTKERYISTKPAPSLGHNLKLLLKNKPLMMVVLSGILGCARMVYTGTACFYFAKYVLKNTSLYSIATILIVPGGLIASVMCPFLQKKFGKKWTYIATHLVGGIVMFIMYFVGYKSTGALIFAAIGLVLLGIPQGINNVMTYALIGDTVEYLEWKTGERGEGICFAMQTFINKMGLAATAFIGVIVYAPAGIDPKLGTIDNPDMLWNVMVLTGAISMLACCIPMFFYTFTEKKQKEVQKILLQRKAEREKNGEQVESEA